MQIQCSFEVRLFLAINMNKIIITQEIGIVQMTATECR